MLAVHLLHILSTEAGTRWRQVPYPPRSPPPAMRQPSPHSSLCTQPLPAGEEARRELGGWNKEEIPVHILQVEPAPWVGWSVVPRFKYCLPQKAPQLPKKLPPSRCPLNS